MDTVTVELDRELVNLLPHAPGHLADKLKEYLVLELYRQHEISMGKAAELLGMDLRTFLTFADQLDIPYIDMSEEELAVEIANARRIE